MYILCVSHKNFKKSYASFVKYLSFSVQLTIMKKILLFAFLLALLNISLAQSFQVLEKSCQGNYVIAKVRETDGSIGYRILDFCPYGCLYGTCLAKRELPIIQIKEVYDVEACKDNPIFISITNQGNRGEIELNVEGEVANWIRVPSRISLDANETKTIAIVASVPCNSTGTHTFTLIGKGAVNFYAPSALRISEKTFLPITTKINPIDISLATALTVFFVLVLVFWKYKPIRRIREEIFES